LSNTTKDHNHANGDVDNPAEGCQSQFQKSAHHNANASRLAEYSDVQDVREVHFERYLHELCPSVVENKHLGLGGDIINQTANCEVGARGCSDVRSRKWQRRKLRLLAEITFSLSGETLRNVVACAVEKQLPKGKKIR
jgi:hypothetical protein